ncbi:GGDEF domain-containing phosphodiesterase [Microvirga roseola]|uniref:GGDEF domain-containing phosphodiesterase n=1 Tax=Microvirga roseola TaxID=2883126 RepID=UPI001E2E530C|nr:GGDEF domain-containing phosphodiesterase [Microvirga roseola]
MGSKRQGRAGIFSGASRTSRRRRQPSLPSGRASSSGTVYAWDLASDTLSWGPHAASALGLDSDDDLPQTGAAFARLVEPGSGSSRHEAIAEGASPSGTYDTRHALRFGPDRVVMVLDCGRWLPDGRGRPAFVRGQLRADIQASTPDLLPAAIVSRSELLRSIQASINEALRLSQTCTLIVGCFQDEDEVTVAEIGHRLRPMMRRQDHFAALGPNCFALALVGCPAIEAASAMRRLADLLRGHPAASSLHLAAACAPDHTFKAVKLLRFAEEALSLGIERGETTRVHDLRHAPSKPSAKRDPFDWLAALNSRSLSLSCRPVVDSRTRASAMTRACAGLALSDGRTVPLPPRRDVDGLALLLESRLLELAADRLARHGQERLALPLSAAALQDPEWLAVLAAHLGARPGIASRFMIEIDESALADIPAVRGRLDAMKALGIGLSVSGFGAGHVALSQIQDLPVDLVRLDGVFIQPLGRSTDDRLYLRTLIDRAQHLGIPTAAEWVDDEGTARLLESWGVDYLDGNLFGELEAIRQADSLGQRKKRA